MQYQFKAVPEILFIAVVSAAAFALTQFVTTDTATDWRLWAVSVGIGASRVAAAALLAGITKLWLAKGA
jgi:hypothetical protein